MNSNVVHSEKKEESNAMHERQRTKDAFPKMCSCGAVYHEPDWMSLPPHGVFLGTDESTGRQFSTDLEIRVCVCGSSMAVQLNESNAAEV